MSAMADSFKGWFNPPIESSTCRETDASATTRTGGSGRQEPVVVWKAANQMEAQIVKGRLHSEDIPAFLRGESLGQIYGLTAGRLASTDVLVPAPLAEKARQILTSDVELAFEEDTNDCSQSDAV